MLLMTQPWTNPCKKKKCTRAATGIWEKEPGGTTAVEGKLAASKEGGRQFYWKECMGKSMEPTIRTGRTKD